jgi:hypothetical protein
LTHKGKNRLYSVKLKTHSYHCQGQLTMRAQKMNSHLNRAFMIFIFAILVLIASIKLTLGAPVQVGILSDTTRPRDPAEEWAWALRGGGVEIIKLAQTDLRRLQEIELLIIDDITLTYQAQRTITNWIKEGGLLIVTGADAALQTRLNKGEAKLESDFVLGEILGARFGGWDPGISTSYPFVVQRSPLISPLLPGDGIRLGAAGIDSDVIVKCDASNVLARCVILDPGATREGVVMLPRPTILIHQAGRGWAMFLTVSLARVTSCYSTSDGDPTDCSGASTGHVLMRWLTANLLWEKKGIQVPLYWEIPAEEPHGMLITGDVHLDDAGYQIRSARLMAELLEPLGIPLSLYIVGRVGEVFPDHVQALRSMPHVEIEAHSSEGVVYHPRRKKGLHGTPEVLEDTRQARRLLGLDSKSYQNGWRTSMRTHGWGSDQAAWLGLHKAGVGLILDQVGDYAKRRDHNTPPLIWFRMPVAYRLFIPLADRSINTMRDDFILPNELSGELFSIPSPQCDPCCNNEVAWEDYQKYVEEWHAVFDRIASMGGLAEVWLWHPSTAAWKGGLGAIVHFLSRIRSASTVQFLQGHAFATWLSNRERISVTPAFDDTGKIRYLRLRRKRDMLPLPPGSPADYGRVFYWVLGEASVPGWEAKIWKDPFGRPVTVLHAPINPSS